MWVIEQSIYEIEKEGYFSAGYDYNVGYYDPSGRFQNIFQYNNTEEAAYQCAYLNGGPSHQMREALEDAAAALEAIQKIQSGILDILERKWG